MKISEDFDPSNSIRDALSEYKPPTLSETGWATDTDFPSIISDAMRHLRCVYGGNFQSVFCCVLHIGVKRLWQFGEIADELEAFRDMVKGSGHTNKKRLNSALENDHFSFEQTDFSPLKVRAHIDNVTKCNSFGGHVGLTPQEIYRIAAILALVDDPEVREFEREYFIKMADKFQAWLLTSVRFAKNIKDYFGITTGAGTGGGKIIQFKDILKVSEIQECKGLLK